MQRFLLSVVLLSACLGAIVAQQEARVLVTASGAQLQSEDCPMTNQPSSKQKSDAKASEKDDESAGSSTAPTGTLRAQHPEPLLRRKVSGVGSARPAARRRLLRPRGAMQRAAAMYSTVTVLLSPLFETDRITWLLDKLGMPPAICNVILGLSKPINNFRERHTLGVLMCHEVFTDVVADVFAQAIAAEGDNADEKPDDVQGVVYATNREGGGFEINWPRTARSAAAALISDDIPFLAWSRFLWHSSERFVAAVQRSSLSPAMVRAITHPMAVSVGKTAVTQVMYESCSNAIYLSLQAAFRREGFAGVVRELKSKFFRSWIDGVYFWSFAHMVVFLMPIWWLQPIVDNLFTLVFNTYLAFLANAPIAE